MPTLAMAIRDAAQQAAFAYLTNTPMAFKPVRSYDGPDTLWYDATLSDEEVARLRVGRTEDIQSTLGVTTVDEVNMPPFKHVIGAALWRGQMQMEIGGRWLATSPHVEDPDIVRWFERLCTRAREANGAAFLFTPAAPTAR